MSLTILILPDREKEGNSFGDFKQTNGDENVPSISLERGGEPAPFPHEGRPGATLGRPAGWLWPDRPITAFLRCHLSAVATGPLPPTPASDKGAHGKQPAGRGSPRTWRPVHRAKGTERHPRLPRPRPGRPKGRSRPLTSNAKGTLNASSAPRLRTRKGGRGETWGRPWPACTRARRVSGNGLKSGRTPGGATAEAGRARRRSCRESMRRPSSRQRKSVPSRPSGDRGRHAPGLAAGHAGARARLTCRAHGRRPRESGLTRRGPPHAPRAPSAGVASAAPRRWAAPTARPGPARRGRRDGREPGFRPQSLPQAPRR